ncbi:Imm49 family immunity protein [Lacihabitans soyangensis]|uniref:Uncharacterized protein n=1 Tax=Lacihabitans soyangensis TaxID=869394 RepID=A0AAE3KW04_9BACT|nr:Imm49 family immunity protein [Lacihabitans soyangensis]MCP9764826.1 hypothetical protein [Lacihabitans soyangensis]
MIQELQEKLELCSKNEHLYLEYLKNPEYNAEYLIMNLISCNLQIAANEIFGKKDIYKGKNCFFRAALLKLFLHENYDKGTYTSSNLFLVSNGFMYSILSDNPKLINRLSIYEDNFLDTFGACFAKAIQACMRGDNKYLIEQITNLERHTRKGNAKNYSGISIAFKGLMEFDKNTIEEGIKEILSKHNKQEQPTVIKDYLNLEALTLAKLALRKGILVNIDNPLLPKEMIPINALENYKGYDILKEIEAFL